MKPFLIAALLACAAATPAFAGPPSDLVAEAYAQDSAVAPSAGNAHFYSADLAKALNADQAGGEVNAIEFDWRYDAQDWELANQKSVETIVDPDHAKVAVSFTNFGKPETVTWSLCRRADNSWRVSDVAGGNAESGPWTLRGLLSLSTSTTC